MAGTQAVTILFCDLVASTERRARMGDDAFDEFNRRFMIALDRTIAEHSGRNIASAGDGLMVVFPDSVADAVACATTMHRSVAELDPQDPPQLRIGISTGEVANDDGAYSGMPIVEAARLEAAAKPGQTLANSVVRTLIGTRRAFRFRDVGALSLKGIPMPLSTVEVVDAEVLDMPSPGVSPPPAPVVARTPRRRGPLLVGAIALVVVVVAATVAVVVTHSNPGPSAAVGDTVGVTAPQGYTPRYVPTPCPSSVLSVASDATCGHLIVPQDRSHPDGRKVSLLVSSAPPRLPGPTIAPTIDVCGCENLGSSLARDHSELIDLAIRGESGSNPDLTCPQMSAVQIAALSQPSLEPKEIALGTDALRHCYARFMARGIDPSQYNYNTAAEDLRDLMFALHIQKANFIAYEYADAEVFDVVRQAPAAVRSITLDNPPPPGATALTDPIGDLAGAFQRFVALCRADSVCATGYPDLEQTKPTLYDQLEANPPLVTVPNPNGSNLPPVQVLVDGHRAADALASALADPATYPLIPQAREAATQSAAYTTIATGAVDTDYPSPDESWGATASYTCSYDVNTQNLATEALEANELPQFVRAISAQWTQWCRAWPVPDLSAGLSQPVVSNVPALFFRGNLSPDGNPDWIPMIARGLSDVQSVVFPTLGSDLLADGPPCLSALRRQFLADPTKTLDTAACAKQSPPIQFVAPGA